MAPVVIPLSHGLSSANFSTILVLTHSKVFWVFLLLSQAKHFNSQEWEYHLASSASHYFSFFHFAEFSFYFSCRFLEALLNYLPAESQFGALCSFFDWCIFLTDFLVYWLLGVFVFFFFLFLPVLLLGTLFFLANLKSFCPDPLVFSLSKLVATALKKKFSVLWSLCFVFLSPPPSRLWFTTPFSGSFGVYLTLTSAVNHLWH